jgi:predicted Fe-Mo cluster-binding NifX family protein
LILLDTKTEEPSVIDNSRSLNAPQGAGIQTAKEVVTSGVDAVITGHIGPKALEALEAADVEVYLEASGTVGESLEKMKSGQLKCRSKTSPSQTKSGER